MSMGLARIFSFKEGRGMKYSKEDIIGLVKSLRSHGEKYESVADFFHFHLTSRDIEFGLSNEQGASLGSFIVVESLKSFFPDVYFALNLPLNQMPLYIDKGIGQEYPIAVWRLSCEK
jgi:hypothetical protein